MSLSSGGVTGTAGTGSGLPTGADALDTRTRPVCIFEYQLTPVIQAIGRPELWDGSNIVKKKLYIYRYTIFYLKKIDTLTDETGFRSLGSISEFKLR